MAIKDSKSYFSNSIPGAMVIGPDTNIYKIDTVAPRLAVGTKLERQDGSVYRYVHIGAEVPAGAVLAPDLNLTSAQIYSANAVIASNNAFQQDMENAGMLPNMLGSRFVVIQRNNRAADDYAGAYLGISSGGTMGHCFRIKGNKASNGTATVLELYDPLPIHLATALDIAIAPSKYQGLMLALGSAAGTTQSGLPVGVAVRATAGTSSWGWVCTKGVTAVRQSGTVVQGKDVAVSDTDAGFIEAIGSGAGAQTGSQLVALLNMPIVGKVVLPGGGSSMNALVDVNLD
jgi:hypothetical protein